MSSKHASEYIVQNEIAPVDSLPHWENRFTCAGADLHAAEAALARTARNLHGRKPHNHTGRYRLVCRVTVVEEHQVGEVIDNRNPV